MSDEGSGFVVEIRNDWGAVRDPSPVSPGVVVIGEPVRPRGVTAEEDALWREGWERQLWLWELAAGAEAVVSWMIARAR